MSPRPSTACPKSRALARRATKVMTNPRPTTSSDQSVILKAISCTVSVVPMSAPRMMPSVWRNVMMPADTNPISISVVAAEDWMMAVTVAPEATATHAVARQPGEELPEPAADGALQAVAAQPDAVEQQRGAAEHREQDHHGAGRPVAAMLPRSSWAGVRSPVRWPVSFRLTSRGGRTTVSEALSTRSRHRSLKLRAEQVARVDADHAAVGDDQHVVAVGMGGGDAVHRGLHARVHVGQRLAVRRRAIVGRAQPRPVRVAVPGAHVVDRAALPLPERELAQLGQDDLRHARAAQGDLRRLHRPAVRAHVGRAHADSRAAPGPAPRPGPGRAADSAMSVGPGSAARRSTPTRRGGRAGASRGGPDRVPRRAQARQHFRRGRAGPGRRRAAATRSGPSPPGA